LKTTAPLSHGDLLTMSVNLKTEHQMLPINQSINTSINQTINQRVDTLKMAKVEQNFLT